MRHRDCDDRATRGRLSKARQFYKAAELILEFADDEDEVGDAFVTLCIHAGIAAADAICCRDLGHHAQGQDHDEAVELLRRVADGEALAKALRALLDMKTRAGYSHETVSAEQRTRAGRRARQLVDEAIKRLGA